MIGRWLCLAGIGCAVVYTTSALAVDDIALRQEYRRYALENPGDADAGRQLFEENKELACTSCHAITGIEKSGPNLDGIADKYPPKELIRHILEPNAFIQPGYETASILTTDGRTIVGRIRLATRLEYRLLNAQGRLVRVERDEIETLQASPVSLMPENQHRLISRSQFADLIAYLGTLHAAVQTGLVEGGKPIAIDKIERAIDFVPVHPPAMRFESPVWVTEIPGHPGQLVVLEHQQGRALRLDLTTEPPQQDVFLDLHDEIAYSANQGLMCLAFHPDFAQNGRYFVKYEVPEQGSVKTTIAQRQASADRLGDSGQPSQRLLELEQPAFNHNGGCLGFGPDGMLYVAFGDGGPQKDPHGYSQNPRIFHGSFLRIDVNGGEPPLPYRIPPDNPFVEASLSDPEIRAETWAIGMREPWRFSFDALTGDLWVGDVGQVKFEEVAIVRAGENHGWNVMEAFEPFSDQYRREDAVYTPPLFAYPHSFGASVTGGYVYRGDPRSSFYGVYVFGDYESRRVWGLKQEDGVVTRVRELGEAPEHIASFGEGLDGTLYLVGYEGTIYRVDLSHSQFD